MPSTTAPAAPAVDGAPAPRTLAEAAAPGAFQLLTVSAAGQDTEQRVPVMLPTGQYEKYAPEGWEAPERPTREDLEEARAKGRAKKVADLEEKIRTQEAWLAQARTSLSDFA